MEASLVALLRALCPQVFPDIARAGAAVPYVVYQHIGGQPLRYLDGSAVSLRHSAVQIGVYAATRQSALTLMRQIEDALCAASVTAFTARPASEPIGGADELTDIRSCLQDFDIWGPR